MAAPMRCALHSTARSSSLSFARCITTTVDSAKASTPQPNIAANDGPPPAPYRPQPGLCSGISPRISSGSSHHTFFDPKGPLWVGAGGDQPPDPNKANLGNTLRILQERLPTLLQSPLPQDLLAPNISLHLFPSTHPHLPTVSGRVAYNAALWTSPIAWNRVPIIGNVKIEILAERVTTEPITFLPRRAGAIPEQLVVRWCEKRKPAVGGGSHISTIAKSLRLVGREDGVEANKAFTGLFIFDFDQEGRILSHTIETAQEGGNWEKGVGAKFVGLTDWLLGGIRDPGGSGTPLPMFERTMMTKKL
ncbi:hypothetical protein V2G26_015916 [Clonostachys chloroleuca]